MIRLRNREGIALAAAIFGIVVISLITAGAFMMTDLDTKATRNREDAATALRLAHSAEAHALSLFRNHLDDTTISRLLVGWDNTSGTADDGMFIDWAGIDNTNDIPAAGRTTAEGTYWASMMDDPNDPNASPYIDANWRFLVRCIGQTVSGSRAVIEMVVRYRPPLPAIAMEGNTTIQGTPVVSGACGDIHVNQNVSVSGNLTVNSALTVSGSPSGSGNILNASGVNVGPTVVPDVIPIPIMQASDYCATAEYVLQANGTILQRSTGISHPAVGTIAFGWERKTATAQIPYDRWESITSVSSGSFCAQGNVLITGNPGSVGSPLPISVYATGSIGIAGNPNFSAYDSNDIVLLADGDIHIAGNSNTNYDGIIYGGSNCRASGNLNLSGQFLCQTGPLPAGAAEIVAVNLIEGNTRFSYSCAWAEPNDKYRIETWYQRMNM
ncbi:MAG TPA: hypothetical protein VFZ69_03950 [Longimicrobiales bacterium]